MTDVSKWTKKIIHVDMDAFFAAIEQRDRPELQGKPVIVGGDPGRRGVVSTCSYEARKYGIRSAMPAASAKRLCPQAVFLRPDFEKYQEVSRIIMKILAQHTALLEPVSLDEAYLDVTHHKLGIEDPVTIAKLIKQNIFAVTRLTASAGVAPNLFLAKIASDYQKPDGLTVIPPAQVLHFLENLPVKKIPGVGPVTEKALHQCGLKNCSDLARAGRKKLMSLFGKWGAVLYDRSLGIDEREVEINHQPKQYSCEETFESDILDPDWLVGKIREFAEGVFRHLKESGKTGRTVVLKVKYGDFKVITRSCTLQHSPDSPEEIASVATQLLLNKTEVRTKKVRLLGLGVSGIHETGLRPAPIQKDLFN